MDKWNKNAAYLEWLLFIGMMIGFVTFGIYSQYELYRGILFIILDIILMTIVFVSIKLKYQTDITQYLDKLTTNIKNISEEEGELKADEDDPKLKELYAAVNELQKNLKQQNRSKDTTFKIINTLAVNIDLQKLLNELLPKVIEGTRSNWGAVYVFNSATGKLEIKTSLGFSKNIYKEFDITLGEGFIGQAVQSKKIQILEDIPDNTVYISRTFIGTIKPKCMMTVPIMSQGELVATLVLASIYNYTDEQMDVVKMIRYYLGVAITNGLAYERTQRLTKELQFQNQLIQNLNDELEQKVKYRTNFLNNIINSIKDYAIITTDEDGFITTWNTGAEILKGQTAQEIIGKNISILYTEIEVRTGKVQQILKIAREQGKYTESGWERKKDGTRFFADVTILPIYDDEENLVGYTNIVKDITSLKKLETELNYERVVNEKVLESSTRALLLTTSKGAIKYSNIIAETLLKQYNERTQNKNISEFFEEAEELRRNIYDVSKHGGKSECIKTIIDENGIRHKIRLIITLIGNDISEIDDTQASIMIYLKEVKDEKK